MIVIKFLIISLTIMSSNTFEIPDYCGGLECPQFELISSENNIEIREYKTSHWVSTDMKGGRQDDLKSKGFMTLFNYISGKNESKEKISMTAPVLLKVNSSVPFTSDDQVSTMSFFLGYNYQNEEAPIPSESKTYLQKTESKKYAIITYSGYSNQKEQEENLRILGNYLNEKKINFNKNYYFFAGYNSPIKFFNRHNEVWIELL